MTNQHPITPPSELVDKWVAMLEYCEDIDVFTDVASWGYDQAVKELETFLENWSSSTGVMKPKIRAILEDCVERGIHHTILNKDPDISDSYLEDKLFSEIWLQIDTYFTFEDEL